MNKIYYVGARLTWKSTELLAMSANLKPPTKQFHTTIIYSRKWFPYREADFFPLTIEPPFEYDQFDKILVLRHQNSRLFERHIEFRNLGATWDYDDFKGHITLTRSPLPISFPQLKIFPPQLPIVLEKEYYQTWEEKEEEKEDKSEIKS